VDLDHDLVEQVYPPVGDGIAGACFPPNGIPTDATLAIVRSSRIRI
jgi:hypothetical protein